MNPFSVSKYQLYLLQAENYEFIRFWRLLFGRGVFNYKNLRKNLVWTAKAFVVLLVGQVLMLLLAAWPALYLHYYFGWSLAAAGILGLIVFIFLQFISFIFFTIGLWLLLPIDAWLKNRAVKKAKAKLLALPKIKIVAVAGSYGKTTAKDVLGQVLSIKYKVLSTPESVNTPVGIARWLVKKVDDSTEIIVAEMGEHYRGDVKELCELLPPDVVVLTGINEAHLERFKNIKNTIATIFEAAQFSKKDALIVLNADDKNITDNYSQYCGSRRVVFYSSLGNPLAEYHTDKVEFDQSALGFKFGLADKHENFGEFKIGLLGEYAVGFASAALLVGKHLGLSVSDVLAGLFAVRPIQHRLQPINSGNNTLIIDDSYNGNPAGVTEAIKTLAKFTGRRKIYITPGLVEMGASAQSVHSKIGQELARVADVVILIKNSVTPFIAEGIGYRVEGRDKPEVMWFDTAPQAHAALGKILLAGDVVLFQNDWGDQYI